MGRKHFKGFTVFRDGAAGEGDSFFSQMFCDRQIAQGLERILLFDKRPDPFQDAFLGFSLAILRSNLL